MSSTPTLDAEYKKVITARYLDKPCTTCGGKLQDGDYAATNDFTTWDSYCHKCGLSFANQIAALVQRIEDTAAPLGDNVPDFITQAIAQLEPLLAAAFAGTPNYQLKKALRDVLQHTINAALPAATPDPLIDALKAIAATNDYESSFARSLVQGHAKYGSLTPNQITAANNMIAKRTSRAQSDAIRAAAARPIPTVEPGLYRSDDGTVRRVYRTGKGRISCRKYNGTDFAYEGVAGLRIVADGVAAGTTRLLNAVEASAFGKQAKRCFNCLSIGRPGHLSDDRSIAVGYGPDCAENNGWWYPTAEEAARILRGDLDLDAKLTQSLTTGVPLVIVLAEDGNVEVAPELDDEDVYIDDEVEAEDGPIVPWPFGPNDGVNDDDDTCDTCDEIEGEHLTTCPEIEAVTNPEWEEGEDEDEILVPRRSKAARDLVVGDRIASGVIASIDQSITPGVVYVAIDGQSTLIFNHGELVNVYYDAPAPVVPQAVTAPPAPVEAPTAPPAATQAPVVGLPPCVRCEEEPATVSFVCHDGEAFKVCPSCRSALVRYRVCPFHIEA